VETALLLAVSLPVVFVSVGNSLEKNSDMIEQGCVSRTFHGGFSPFFCSAVLAGISCLI